MPEQIAKGVIELGGDFEHHRVAGYVPHAAARGMDPNLDCALISHVRGNLYQGGCFQGVRLPDGFRNVISLYPWEQYLLPVDCSRYEYKLYDSLDQALNQIDEIASRVLELEKHGPILVHCQAGLNRSGLVTARALILDGMNPAEAIALLRKRSPLVLSNEAFEGWLRA